jgi:hypothetical protein
MKEENMNIADYLSVTGGQLMLAFVQIIILVVQVSLAWSQYSSRKRLDSIYQCDALYLNITKLMIEDEDLIDFYDLNEGPWKSMTIPQKKMYLLAELNYFHFAFVRREFLKKRVDEDYWRLYERWLTQLLRSNNTFRKVHEDNSALFEGEFARHVNKLLTKGA